MVQPSDTIIVSLDDVIVTAEIEVNTYMSEKGNPYLLVVSPFTKRKVHSILDTPYYAYDIQTQNRTESQYCNLKITYTFDFGRKTGKVKRSIDNEINSALLRVT